MRALDVTVQKRSRWMIVSIGLLIGFGGQAGGLYAAHTLAPAKTEKPKLVQMNLVKAKPKPKPKPKTEPKPEPPKPEPPKPKPEPKPEPKAEAQAETEEKETEEKKRKKRPKPKEALEAPKPSLKSVKKVPLVTGITGQYHAGASGMTVQVNTQMGAVGDTAVDPVTNGQSFSRSGD